MFLFLLLKNMFWNIFQHILVLWDPLLSRWTFFSKRLNRITYNRKDWFNVFLCVIEIYWMKKTPTIYPWVTKDLDWDLTRYLWPNCIHYWTIKQATENSTGILSFVVYSYLIFYMLIESNGLRQEKVGGRGNFWINFDRTS